MDITQDIQALTTFRNNSVEVLRQLKTTKRPIILTVDGEPQAVLQDPASYQRLLDIAIQANASNGIDRRSEDAAPGRFLPVKKGAAQLGGKYNVPR